MGRSLLWPALRQLRLHDLYEPVGGGAVFNILFEDVHIIDHPLTGVVGKTSAIMGADRIDAAFIVFQIQELAGLFLVDPVALFILIQILFPELFRRHPQMSRNPDDIGTAEGGRHGLAAVSAGKAIGMRPGLGIGLQGKAIKAPWRCIADTGKKTSQPGLGKLRLFPEAGQVDLVHSVKIFRWPKTPVASPYLWQEIEIAS